MLAIKWAWRHYVMTFDEFDTLDEAVRSALYAADYGDESLQCIEVIEDDGTRVVYDRAAVSEMWLPLEEAERAEMAARPATVVVLDLRSPSGDWSPHRGFADERAAEQEAERLRAILGPERVALRPSGQRRAS